MDTKKTIKILESLAQETRLKAFKTMVKAGKNGISAGDISTELDIIQNTMSFHLSHLENSGLIKSKKQGRRVIYSVNFRAVEGLINYLLESCCIESQQNCQITNNLEMACNEENSKNVKILILCGGNSCRSIMLEALIRHYNRKEYITSYSAGNKPAGKINELAVKTLERNKISADGLCSKSWNNFYNEKIDIVITVCDLLNNETCPVFLHDIPKVHFNISDPTKFIGTQQEIEAEFLKCFGKLKNLALNISDIIQNYSGSGIVQKLKTSLCC